nr:aromatic ring-hydroxylating dioxygenase subunit alpha [Sphingobium boeckii]
MPSLFQKGWQFVSMTDELANDQDFVTLDLPGTAVVVQNFAGALRAFRNVCPHRLNLVQTEERGNRPLICRYHGWAFDSGGRPKTLPPRQEFPSGGDDERLCLQRFHVEICGRFVFVSMEESPPSLTEFLGEFALVLDQLSRVIGPLTNQGTIAHACNWKLLVENVLECYHCGFVHPETFVKGLGIGKKAIADVRIALGHSSSHFPKSPTARDALKARAVAHLIDREYVHESFFHVHIFPNLFISSSEGAAFYVGHAVPISAGETNLRTRFFAPKIDLDDRAQARQDLINRQAVTLGKQVIGEDKTILENVQRGMGAANRLPVLGADEIRIKAFASAYEAAMNG